MRYIRSHLQSLMVRAMLHRELDMPFPTDLSAQLDEAGIDINSLERNTDNGQA